MSIIRLDLGALVKAGSLSAEEAARLTGLALPDRRGGLLVNVLLIFGALAVAAAAIALVPDAGTGLFLALAALAGAEGLRRFGPGEEFKVLSAGLALMGTLGLAGWTAWHFREAPSATQPALLITLVLAAGAAWFRSAFLAALGVVALGAVFGTGSGYWHASYALFVEEPALTIFVFGALAAGLYALRKPVAEAWSGLLTSAARTAMVLVHFAFWVGSLWGDVIGDAAWSASRYDDYAAYEAWEKTALTLPEWPFSIGWAGLALALALLTRRGGFLSVSALVFLGIHGYTQYFETFGAEPVTLLIAGLTLVALAVATPRLMKAWKGGV
ncbi:hypothetical protein [Hyphomonas sp.]|uniref:hypothetical protein n=1 Tax=Hyphomonas sp. TaxID=87 RepID=UPI00391D237F